MITEAQKDEAANHVIGGRSALELPGFATGGDAMIGGPYKGIDKTLVAFWGTTGESVHVRTPQQRDAGGAAAGPTEIRPVFKIGTGDRRDFDDSYGSQQTLVELERKTYRRRRR